MHGGTPGTMIGENRSFLRPPGGMAAWTDEILPVRHIGATTATGIHGD
jgi:hypothetical protein